jgi:hypothetical protein
MSLRDDYERECTYVGSADLDRNHVNTNAEHDKSGEKHWNRKIRRCVRREHGFRAIRPCSIAACRIGVNRVSRPRCPFPLPIPNYRSTGAMGQKLSHAARQRSLFRSTRRGYEQSLRNRQAQNPVLANVCCRWLRVGMGCRAQMRHNYGSLPSIHDCEGRLLWGPSLSPAWCIRAS